MRNQNPIGHFAAETEHDGVVFVGKLRGLPVGDEFNEVIDLARRRLFGKACDEGVPGAGHRRGGPLVVGLVSFVIEGRLSAFRLDGDDVIGVAGVRAVEGVFNFNAADGFGAGDGVCRSGHSLEYGARDSQDDGDGPQQKTVIHRLVLGLN